MSIEGMEHSHVTPESPEMSKREYNFPEIMQELEPAVLSCVEQLKEAIETGEYSTLISDDARGRIPTLILRRIFAEKAPNAESLQTYFLAFGREQFRWDKAMDEFVKKHKDTLGKSLIITEYIDEGHTIGNIKQVFDRRNSYNNYDITSLYTNQKYIFKQKKHSKLNNGGTSEGDVSSASSVIHPVISGVVVHGREPNLMRAKGEGGVSLGKLSGVGRRTIDSALADMNWWKEDGYPGYTIGAHPERIDKLYNNPEPSQEEMRLRKHGFMFPPKPRSDKEFLSRLPGEEYDRKLTAELRNKVLKERGYDVVNPDKRSAQKEKAKVTQELIYLARQDVEIMALDVMEKVWGKDNE